MRTSIISLLAAASLASAQSSTVTPAPKISDSPAGASYVATLPIKEGSPIRGSIAAVSAPDGVGVKFSVSFSGLPATGGPFMYHLHEKAVPTNGNCTGTGAHLDPYKRGEVPICDASKPETCQTGDLSGKYGNITAQEWSAEYVILLFLDTIDKYGMLIRKTGTSTPTRPSAPRATPSSATSLSFSISPTRRALAVRTSLRRAPAMLFPPPEAASLTPRPRARTTPPRRLSLPAVRRSHPLLPRLHSLLARLSRSLVVLVLCSPPLSLWCCRECATSYWRFSFRSCIS
jgi:hypothetical protein